MLPGNLGRTDSRSIILKSALQCQANPGGLKQIGARRYLLRRREEVSLQYNGKLIGTRASGVVEVYRSVP